MEGLYVLYVAGVLAAALGERVVHALCLVVWQTLHGTESNVRTLSAYGVLGAAVQGGVGVSLAFAAVTTTVFGGIVTAGRWVLRIALLGVLFTFLFEYYPQLVEDVIGFYNDGFGSGLRAVLFETIKLLYQFTSLWLPIYNALVYIPLKILTTVIIPGLEFDPGAFLSFLGALGDFLRHLIESFSGYLTTFSACAPVANTTLTDTSCFEPGLRMLDLVTPMGDVRMMVGHAVTIVGINCELLAAPIDLLMYPLMDINLAKAVHNLVNSVLLGVLQVPLITYERCRYSAESTTSLGVLMCVPDFEPVWNTFSSGVRFLGRVLDNWVNIAALILEETVTGDAPTCAAPPLGTDIAAPDPGLFEGRETAVVGLTPGMYAITDGVSTQYTVYWSAVQRLVVSHSWPIAIDVSHGVAAVRYSEASAVDDSGHATTSMLGCRCSDLVDGESPTGVRVSISCGISPYDAEAYDTMHLRVDDYILPVEFQLPSTAYYMTCAQIQLSVQSVRWPLTRMARPDSGGVLRDASSPLVEGGPIQEPRELDAVVYVVPRCAFSSSDPEPDLVCIDTFTRAGCYPYCLAGRVTGSVNSALILYDSDDWEEHVQLLQRDCGLGEITLAEEGGAPGYEYVRDDPVEEYSTRFDFASNDVGGTTFTTESVAGDVSSGACSYDRNVASRAPKALMPTYGDLQSVRLGDQPFVVAGDASLFVEWENRDDLDSLNDVAYIRVKRLFGTEVQQFTLWTMPTRIPTLGVCETAAECTRAKMEPGLVTVPPAYSVSPGNAAPAVATKWSVLYAVNPSPDIYSSYFGWCAGENPGTQFQIDSAYGPIRLWRVDAFVEDAWLATQMARDDVWLEIEAFNRETTWEYCANAANMSVTGMAYLNEYNVAVTVLRASPRYFDVQTKRPRADAPEGGGEVSYDVYYLNPQTMALRRDDMWEEETPVSTLAQGYLCADMRRMPAFGGLFAETAVAFSTLVRFPMTVIVNIPALAPGNLAALRECPLVTRGHTMLRECGANVLSLAYFWEAIIRGNEYFWRSFSDIAAIFQGSSAAETAHTMLNGVTWTGANGYNVMPKAGYLSPTVNKLVNRTPRLVRPFFVAVGQSIGLTRFVYELVSELILSFLAADSFSAGDVVGFVWEHLYNMRLRYDEIVTTPGLAMCTGVGMLLGWGNPYAQLARDVCVGQVLGVPTLLNLGDVFFVHYPMLHCMCDMPVGVELEREAADRCFEMAPLQYKPVISEVIEKGAGQFRGMCIEMSEVVNDALLHAPDLLISTAYDVAEDLQSTIDYLLVVFGKNGESCTDFYANPYVMVLMPFPLDYFRTCGRTESCRLRCADLFAEFEASKTRTETTPREATSRTLVEKPLLTEDDILNRRTLQPFQILAVIEHPTCRVVCGEVSGETGRCFSVAGIDALERVVVAAYCVPQTRGLGMREVWRAEVARSEEWSPRVLGLEFLHEREPEAGFEALLAIRSDAVVLCTPVGEVRTLVTVLGDEMFYTVSEDAMHYVDEIFVIPGVGETGTGRVVIHGRARRRNFLEDSEIETLCVHAEVDPGILSPLYGVLFLPFCDTQTNLQLEVGDDEMVFARDPDTPLSAAYDRLIIVPTSRQRELRVCEFDQPSGRVQGCLALGPGQGLLYSAATTLSSFRTSVARMFTLSQEGVTSRREDVVSRTSIEGFSLTASTDYVHAFFKTDHASNSGSWLADVRVTAPENLEGVLRVEERHSTSVELQLDFTLPCDVMSCSGCGSLATQKLCYAAQQCALTRCVGSTVHLQRPACMWGFLLKDAAESIIAAGVAVWVSLYEVLHLTVDTATGVVSSEVEVNFPYDASDIIICDVKDLFVAAFGSLMAVVNSLVITMTDSLPDELYESTNEQNAIGTLVIASLTNLLSHIMYGFLYVYFAIFQIIGCTTNSALALFDGTGTSVRVLPGGGEQGWDAVGGQCVTKLAEESLSEFGAGSEGGETIALALDDMLETLTRLTSALPLDMIVHVIDAAITWVIGVTRTLQDVIQVADVRNCRISDTTAKLVGECACGDTPARIPPGRSTHGLYESAFWCAGVLNMVVSDGSSRAVFNPYSHEELWVLVEPTLDAYLDCISGGYAEGEYATCFDLEPRDPFRYFELQGVSLLSVLTRCRGNYVNRQWDEGAALLFNPRLSDDLREMWDVIDLYFRPSLYPHAEVADCLAQSLTEGGGNDRCLDILLALENTKRSEHFAYERTSSGGLVDACEVFTGPAADDIPEFRACLDDNEQINDASTGGLTQTECDIPYFLWSGRSSNRVPVASPHFKLEGSENEERLVVAENMIDEARIGVLRSLDTFLADWQANGLEVSLFTSEGDALHQALDCMVMGPYAGADLWPAAGELPAVRYSRQADVSDPRGLSREFQLPCTGDNLEGDGQMPFTCGSAARRATMKYFLRDYLHQEGGVDLVEIVVNETRARVRELEAVWEEDANFGCPCPVGRDVSCCSESDTAGWTAFLGDTGRQKEIEGTSLTEDLLEAMGDMVQTRLLDDTREVVSRHATAPDDYLWTAEEALLATDLGLYRVHDPIVFYDSSEANSPFAGNQSLFDVCTAHVSGVLFTLPLSTSSYTPTETPYEPTRRADTVEGFLSGIETYVREVTARAQAESPLFWQHVLRHVPSDSQMCLDATSPGATAVRGDIPLVSVRDDGRLSGEHYGFLRENLGNIYGEMSDKGEAPGEAGVGEVDEESLFRFLGAYANSFAGFDERCVCGWEDEEGCYITEEVCEHVLLEFKTQTGFTALVESCETATSVGGTGRARYVIGEEFWQVHRVVAGADTRRVEEGLSPLSCDDMAPSDAWGVLEPDDDWVTGTATTGELKMVDILREGRAGLRAGNLLQVRSHWNRLISPGRRHRPLVHPSDVGHSVAQRWCASSFASRVQTPGLLDRYVDELFPVAQGVRTSIGAEACTRYVIELARLQILLRAELLAAASQLAVTEVWRKRCRSQLNTVAMCNVRGVFDVTPESQVLGECPYGVWDLEDHPTAYITRSCLLYEGGVFYDICSCEDCTDKWYYMSKVRTCPLPLDVRHLATHPAWGGAFHWPAAPEGFRNETEAVALQDAISALLVYEESSPRPLAMNSTRLFADVFDAPSDGAFNAPGDWTATEGISSSTHCDSVVDWWPEDWQDPVGYHVTSPPFADEAGYRVFDNAFVIEREEGEYVKVIYEHDTLRNETLARNHFGASGLCGMHSYGMRMATVNTVRACTRLSRHDMSDPTVPVRSTSSSPSEEGVFEEACAPDYRVPWDVTAEDDFDSRAWTGVVAHWHNFSNINWPPKTLTETTRLPLSAGLGGHLRGSVRETMEGAACFLPRQLVCEAHDDCRNLSLASPENLVCMHGVCAVRAQQGGVFECSQHADCSESGDTLCSGFGMCVPPVLEVTNELHTEVEAQVFSENCEEAARESMFGASPWDMIATLLEDSGFCSYRAWFEQRDLLSRAGCLGSPSCELNARVWGIRHSDTLGDVNRGTLWDEHVLKVSPHACDRDYMHREGLAVCTPPGGECRTSTGDSCEFRRSNITRTQNETGTLPLHTSLAFHNAPYGFLGIEEPFADLYDEQTDESSMSYCSDIAQCHLPKFTMNGFIVSERMTLNRDELVTGRRQSGELVTDEGYSDDYQTITFEDYFTCGAFGFKTNEGCRLDPAVVPLHYIFCVSPPGDIIDKCPWQISFGNVCQRGLTYTPEEAGDMERHLNGLLTNSLQKGFTSFAEYRKLTSCAEAIWDAYQDIPELQGPRVAVWESEDDDLRFVTRPQWLYHFDETFPHTATEFPFAWWVKCTLLSGVDPSPNAVITCDAWERRLGTLQGVRGIRVAEALRRVDGHISADDWEQDVQTGASVMREQWCADMRTYPGDAKQNEKTLGAAFANMRTTLQPREDLDASLDEKCFRERVFDRAAWDRDRSWMYNVEQYYATGDPEWLRDAYLKSSGDITSERDAGDAPVWGEICRYWFSTETWFEEYDNVLSRFTTGGASVPVGSFPVFSAADLDGLRGEEETDECVGVSEVNDDYAPFCIYLRAESLLWDPLIAERFAEGYNSDPPRPYLLLRDDEDPLNRLVDFSSREYLLGDEEGTFFRNLCAAGMDGNFASPPAEPRPPLAEGSPWGEARRRLLFIQGFIDIGTKIVTGELGSGSFEGDVDGPSDFAGDVSGPSGEDGTGVYISLKDIFVQEIGPKLTAGELTQDCYDHLYVGWLAGDYLYISELTQETCDEQLETEGSLAPLWDDAPLHATFRHDTSGQACSLAEPSSPDTCDADWLAQYRLLSGDNYARCDGDAFRFTSNAVFKNNPSGDVCWSQYSTCLEERLRSARRMRVPPGVNYWLYADEEKDDRTRALRPKEEHLAYYEYYLSDFSTAITRSPSVPPWQFCPSADIAKSTGSPGLSEAWEPVSGRDYTDATIFASDTSARDDDVIVEINVPVWSMRLSLEDDVACCREALRGGRPCSEICLELGLSDRLPLQIRREMYRCVECTRANEVYCRGRHDCSHAPLAGLSASERTALEQNGIPLGTRWTYEQLLHAVHVLGRHVLARDFDFTGEMTLTPRRPSFYQVTNIDSFSYFDSTKARDYINSVSSGSGDDLTKCASAGQERGNIIYSQCSNDEYLREFRAFVEEAYRHEAFVRVPAGASAAWHASREQLLGENIFAFAGTDRPFRERFAAWLLDFETHCEETTIYDAICWTKPDNSFAPLNPWVGGDFNPVDFCDTVFEEDDEQRIIDSYCNRPTCPGFYEGNADEDPFFRDIPEQCRLRRGQTQTVTLPRRSNPSNLCTKTVKEVSLCRHPQAALGGLVTPDGYAVDGATVSDLYAETSGEAPPEGLLTPGRRNRLLDGRLRQQAAYEHVTPVRLSGVDIGGHHLHLAVTENQTFIVRAIPLGNPLSDENYLSESMGDQDSSLAWLRSYENLLLAEDFVAENVLAHTEADVDTVGWDCPFLRLHYWSGREEAFSVSSPHPGRAGIMFRDVTDGARAHPLQAADAGSRIGTPYYTSNGRCFCVSPRECSTGTDQSTPCALRDTIRSQYDEEWVEAEMEYNEGAICNDQLDWPYAEGVLRDGTPLPGRRHRETCSIFERLPSFQYRLKNVAFEPPANDAPTTSDEGGDCHLGRGSRAQTRDVRCRLQEKNTTHTTLVCEDGTRPTIEREKITAPEWVVEHARSRRRQCSSTDPPPAFETSSGQPMPAASSFGLHARISAERFLASDLHRLLCRSRGLNCSRALAADEWEMGTFLATLLRDPADLFAPGEVAGNYSSPRDMLDAASEPSDAPLWENPWVSCRLEDGLLAECAGTVPRETWLDPCARPAACISEISAHGDMQLAVNLSICDLDSFTQTLCEALANAEYTVQQAHCIASGACLRETYYYSPGVYSTTNQEFVRETVEEFYLGIDEGACDEREAEREDLLRQVEQLREECSATWLDPIIDLLEELRLVIHSIVRLSYYVFMMELNFFRLLGPGDFTEILQDILYYFVQFLEEAIELIKAIGELLWRMIEESPLGKAFVDFVRDMCEEIVAILNFIKDNICAFLKILLEAVIDVMEAYNSIPLIPDIPAETIQLLHDGVAIFEACMNDDLQCSPEEETFLDPESLALPSATRCWAQYITSFGDDSSLACTAADTCAQGIGGADIICDACPATPPGINEYGCDPIRKVCACGVPQIERTPCVNHLQCETQSDATCSFVDGDAEATFGTIECSQCNTRPRCMLSAGGEAGVCSCALTPLEDTPCEDSALGESVFPGASGICLSAVGAEATRLSLSTTFFGEYSRLLSIPCRSADLTETFCFNVQYSAFLITRRVVSVAVLDTGAAPGGGPFRRLLDTPVDNFFDAEWHDASGLCRDLVAAWRSPEPITGIVDRARLEECLHWRRVARDTIRRHNLSHVGDHFLLSATDFAVEVGRFGALADLVRNPMWIADATLHTTWARPLFAVFSLFRNWTAAFTAETNLTHTPWAEFVFALSRGHATAPLGLYTPSLPLNTTSNASESRPRFRESWAPALAADAPLRPPRVGGLDTTLLRRRLLDWRDGLSAVEQYSLEVTLSGEATQEISPELAEQWVTGPSQWPPDYSYWTDGEINCVSGALAGDIISHALYSVGRAYAGTGPPPGVPAQTFRDSALHVPVTYTAENMPTRDTLEASEEGLVGQITRLLRLAFEFVGIDDLAVYNLFAALPETLDNFFTCDLEEVMFCTEYRRTLWNSFWWVFIYTSIALFLTQFIDVPLRRWLFLILFTPLVLFYAADYSILCFPMIPPCLLDESLQLWDSLLPTRWHWPNALQTYPGCISNDTSMRPPDIDPDAPCIVRCSAAPHAYTRWEAPLAWWLCDLGVPECLSFAEWLQSNQITYSETLQNYLRQKAEMALLGDPDLFAAQRICAALTTWYLAPWLLIATVLLYAATWGAIIPFVAAQSLFAVLVQAYQFSHINDRDRRSAANIYIRRALRLRRR